MLVRIEKDGKISQEGDESTVFSLCSLNLLPASFPGNRLFMNFRAILYRVAGLCRSSF
jgi:hypothetical protein